jgi:uncharacterized protein
VSQRRTAQSSKGSWPAGGRPLIDGVSPLGFEPVTDRILAEIVRRIVAALQPQKIILFGSYVYGAPSNDSDVDLLVILDTNAPPADRYLSVSRLIRPRPFPVDILVKTPAEVERGLKEGDVFIVEIVTKGQVLYERGQ